MYQTRKQNAKADALTWQDKEIKQQDKLKAEYQTQAFLSQDQINPKILQDLGIDLDEITLAPIKDSVFNKSVKLLNQVLRANWEAKSLKALQQQARQEKGSEFTLKDSLLLYSSRLIILKTDL